MGFFDCAGYRLAILLREAIYEIMESIRRAVHLGRAAELLQRGSPANRGDFCRGYRADYEGTRMLHVGPRLPTRRLTTAEPDAIVAEVQQGPRPSSRNFRGMYRRVIKAVPRSGRNASKKPTERRNGLSVAP